MDVVVRKEFIHFKSEDVVTCFSPRNIRDCFFHRRPLFSVLAHQYSQATGLQNYLVLNAHGIQRTKTRPDAWEYEDKNKSYQVQEWIDGHDGEGLALLIACCNPHGFEVSSRRSLIIHPMRSYNGIDLLYGHGHPTRLFMPGAGYLDTSHALRKEIEHLKRLF